jgi:DNA-directed RNA polymerase specialized sigma24 family protein
MTEQEFHTYQEQSFDAFCKAVIRNESINAHKQLAARAEKEIQLSALSSNEIGKLYSEDVYKTFRKIFYVRNIPIIVYDKVLAESLQHLTPPRRDVILLFYFLDYNEAEISRLLHIAKPTVTDRRLSALRKLRKYMEDMENA